MQQPPSEQKMPMPNAQPPAGPMASQGAMEASNQAERKSKREVPMEQLNNAMAKGTEAVATALYKNKKIFGSILKMINEQDKIGSTAKAVVMLLSEINKKSPMPERIMVPLGVMTADEVMQLSEASNRATYSEQEAEQVVMSTAELILSSYGVAPERAQQLASQASKADLQKAESSYNQMLGDSPPQGEQPAQPQEGTV